MPNNHTNTRRLTLALVMVGLMQISQLQARSDNQLQASIFDNIHDLIFGSSSSATSVRTVTTHKAASSSIASIAETSSATSFAPSFAVPTQSWFTVAGYRFPRTIRTGMLGDDVLNLQLILNRNAKTQMAKTGAESPGQETGTFDYKTRIGIIAFQKLNLITAEQLTRLRREQGFAGLTTRVALEKIAKDLVANGQLPSDTKNLHAAAQSAASSLRLIQSSSSSRSTLSTASESSVTVAQASSEVSQISTASSVTSQVSSVASTATSTMSSTSTAVSSVQSTASSVASSVTSAASSTVSSTTSIASSVASSASPGDTVSLLAQSIRDTVASALQTCATPAANPNRIFYIDPINGSMTGDGSQTRPWHTLSEVINAMLINGEDPTKGVVHAGDALYLMTGNHGSIKLSPYQGGGKFQNTDFITVQAAPGQTPVLDSLGAQTISKWVFKGLTIQNPNKVAPQYIVGLDAINNIMLTDNTIVSDPNFMNWTPNDWDTKITGSGIFYRGTCGTMTHNTVQNVQYGIGITGDKMRVEHNLVSFFSVDGIDFASKNTSISFNQVLDHYPFATDGYHNDGMQGQLHTGLLSDVIIDSNAVIESTGTYPSLPLLPTVTGKNYMQGISEFDGDWSRFLIINNVVAMSATHGISLYGTADSLILNNTLVKLSALTTQPWIGTFTSKTGVLPTGNTVRNNVAGSFSLAKDGVAHDHNITFTKPFQAWQSTMTVSTADKVFVNADPTKGPLDFRLKDGSPAIGAGNTLGAPATDVTGKARNSSSIDIGAYAK